MSAKVFVDTNILLYAYDFESRAKHDTSKRVLKDLWRQSAGALSMQVLQEFYFNVTRKIAVPLPRIEARAVVENYSDWCVATTPQEIERAFRIEDEAGINFWDAMIVAAAIRAGATRILSEDLNHGQTIAGVRIENPFAAA
jgi:predicted nucleic acid-binding protein